MARPEWFVKMLELGFPRSPKHSRITKIPFIERYLEKHVFEGDDLVFCLPKDKVIKVEQEVRKSKDMVLPSQALTHFIEEARYHWIMNFCICRESLQCKDYPINYGCLFMGEAAMGINPKFGRRVEKEEALDYAVKCREAGLVHLMGKAKMDTWWLGVGPGEKLLTVCNCCPCCCISRNLAYSGPRLKEKLSRMPGVIVAVTDKCNGCGVCLKTKCFADAIRLENGRAYISGECRACGRCASVCPQKAIEVTLDREHSIPVTISRLSRVVDIK